MEGERCARCKAPIEGEAVEFVGRIFCSDTCCEQFEDFVTKAGEPVADDLGEDADVGAELDDLDDLDDLDELDDLDDSFDDDDTADFDTDSTATVF